MPRKQDYKRKRLSEKYWVSRHLRFLKRVSHYLNVDLSDFTLEYLIKERNLKNQSKAMDAFFVFRVCIATYMTERRLERRKHLTVAEYLRKRRKPLIGYLRKTLPEMEHQPKKYIWSELTSTNDRYLAKRYREKKKKELINSHELIDSLKEQHRRLIMENTSQSDRIHNLEAEQESLKEQIRQLSILNTSLSDTINRNIPLLLDQNTNTIPLSPVSPPNQEINILPSNQELNNPSYNRNTPFSLDQNLSDLFSCVPPSNQEISEINQEPPYFIINLNTPLLLDQNSSFTTLYLNNLF
ncbi:3187_t:CDS:2 [Ambispora gerdemannii]|uniref:3187_t:CDS:1 n=1 Tax=Ambispora gerdemannii TaxID=144530 RepID=A0A9N9C238_9GLOM|nr:3187_t:CDS:2 [Ambispora gerdemannii]